MPQYGADTGVGSGTCGKALAVGKFVRVLHKREVFSSKVLRIEEATLQQDKPDGSLSDQITRLVMHRGDSVAVLMHVEDTDDLLFVEQFRYPTYEHGLGWLLEIPAGVVDEGEEPEAAARREVEEETGYRVSDLIFVSTIYPSPGASSERISIYYARVSPADLVSEGGGVDEGEDVRLVRKPVTEAVDEALRGELVDGKTVVALLWLHAHRRERVSPH